MFTYFHDMLSFGAIYRKKWHKTADFRDLLLEGAIFIVGTQKKFLSFKTFLLSCVPGNHGYAKDILQFTNISGLCSIRENIYETRILYQTVK